MFKAVFTGADFSGNWPDFVLGNIHISTIEYEYTMVMLAHCRTSLRAHVAVSGQANRERRETNGKAFCNQDLVRRRRGTKALWRMLKCIRGLKGRRIVRRLAVLIGLGVLIGGLTYFCR